MATDKLFRRNRIKKRIRKVVVGNSSSPRLTVFRSNKDIYAQLIDDTKGLTIGSASSVKDDSKVNKIDQAKSVGKKIAEIAIAKGIKNVHFDRNGYLYHGRVKSLADSAREAGLIF